MLVVAGAQRALMHDQFDSVFIHAIKTMGAAAFTSIAP